MVVTIFITIAVIIFAERGTFGAVIHILKNGSMGLDNTEVGILGSVFMGGYMVGIRIATHLS